MSGSVPAVPKSSGPTRAALQAYVGKSVGDFCDLFGKKGDAYNHCAHWVSHALGLRFGKLCSQMVWAGRKRPQDGRSIVVSDIFAKCKQRGYWKDKPASLKTCLIFCALKYGVGSKGGVVTLGNIRQKHVGIYLAGECYNYHNRGRNEGVKVDGVALFQRLYGKGTVALYGSIP